MPPRLLLLVLDAFSPKYCTRAIAPHLVRAGEEGAWARGGGRAVLPSVTYPNHASLVTGRAPADHGIFATNTFTGDGIRPARDVGARGASFLDAARAAGLRTAVVVGDANILGVVGASRCDAHWPPGGMLPPGTPLVRGYAANAVTFGALLETLDQGADVVLCQLDNTDGFSHEYGPDSSEAVAAHAEADGLVGTLLDGLRRDARWPETIVALISDHTQFARDLDAPPIDVVGALLGAGIEAEVIPDGSAVLVRARDIDGARRAVGALDGVVEAVPFAPGILYGHARPGRAFKAAKPLPRGIHGCPGTATTLCMATGGHPGLAALRAAFAAGVPTSATLGRLLTSAIGLRW
jgi:hypothetical protein